MNDFNKSYFRNLFWILAAFVVLITLVNNTVFPIINGEPAYAVFNVLVCALAGWFVYTKLKKPKE